MSNLFKVALIVTIALAGAQVANAADQVNGVKVNRGMPSPSKKTSSVCPRYPDLDCKDFDSSAQATACLRQWPGDPHRLDRDKDGKACELND